MNWRAKALVLALAATVAVAVFWQLRDVLSLRMLAERESELRSLQDASPLLVLGAAFVVYVVVTGLSLPFATVLTLLYGWYFRFWPALLLVSFASTAGATLAFLLSRYLLRDVIRRRLGTRLKKFDEAFAREGAYYLFSLRLVPAAPFFVVNAAMGLTNIRTTTFWWVSQLGMLAGTVVYVYAGSSVPSLAALAENGAQAVFTGRQLLQFTIAFALLGLFPLVARRTLAWLRPARN
ncbi:MAG: TVP38/TMEM64 family protein [Planctomycetales bacterium]|nr:TVP38/TMEM64 family protein [Planctomycetales bacterium]